MSAAYVLYNRATDVLELGYKLYPDYVGEPTNSLFWITTVWSLLFALSGTHPNAETHTLSTGITDLSQQGAKRVLQLR